MKLFKDRLLWAMRQKSERDNVVVTEADLMRATGASGASANYWVTGKNAAGAKNCRKLGAFLGVDALWLETGKEVAEALSKDDAGSKIDFAQDVRAHHPEDELDDESIAIPESKISFSAGPGHMPTFDVIDEREPVTYRRSWFQKERINPKHVCRFRIVGDSMEPFLFAGDSILVNRDETSIVDGRVYAIRYGDDLRVKILSRRLDGTLTLRSFNSEKYKDEEVTPAVAEEHISVIGRVRDKSGTGGL